MTDNFKTDATFVRHPAYEGVFLKHFFCSEDNDRLSNLEVNIVPGFMIEPHTHEGSTEFFYVVRGQGEYFDGVEWKDVGQGAAFKAPQGTTHAIRNSGNETLVLFSTFSPAAR